MPIFRIVGGSNSNSSTRNFTDASNSNSGSGSGQNNNNSSNSNANQTNARPSNAGRHMYPGQRIAAAAGRSSLTSNNTTFPAPPGRVGGSLSAGLNLNSSSNTNGNGNGNGSSVSSTSAARGHMALQQAAQPSNPSPINPAAASSSSASSVSSTNNSNVVVRGTNVGDSGRPGAYAVTRTTTGPAQVYRVTVPPGVRSGSEFTVHAGARRVRVRCPPASRPGHSLQITLPPEPITHHQPLKMAPLTSASGAVGGGYVAMTQEVQKVNQAAKDSGGTAQTFLVTIPPNIYPGMQFTVNVNGQRFMVTCPTNAGPNMKVRIVPPTQREEPLAAPKTQVFEVAVPAGVRPNQPFTLMANGQRVLVTCPPDVVPGQKIRFQLPVQQVIGNIQLSYESESGGWCRTIRVTDLKFQWVRVNGKESEAVENMDTFDFSKAAYVRKLHMMEGNDARMRTGTVELVPAQDAVVDSRLVYRNKTLLSYADIANVQGKSLEDKMTWFQSICTQLTAEWDEGHAKLVVRRHSLLNDSVDAVMSLGREDLRKRWRVEFLGEPGIDAGGVTREWFQLVTEQIFDPDFGLWLSSVNNQMCMTINPASSKFSTWTTKRRNRTIDPLE
jgi:hypothetical protein